MLGFSKELDFIKSEKTMMDFNQFKQQFQQIELLQADPAIFLTPQIPMNKILGAMSYLPPQTKPEEVLVLVDETVFGH